MKSIFLKVLWGVAAIFIVIGAPFIWLTRKIFSDTYSPEEVAEDFSGGEPEQEENISFKVPEKITVGYLRKEFPQFNWTSVRNGTSWVYVGTAPDFHTITVEPKEKKVFIQGLSRTYPFKAWANLIRHKFSQAA